MKKVIIACLVLVSLASCSNNSKPKADTAVPMKEITTEVTTTTEVATEIPPATEPDTEATTAAEINQLIYNEQGIEVYYNDIDTNIINLNVVNANDANVLVYLSEIKVNGNDIGLTYFEERIPANASITRKCEIPLEKLQEQNISRINELEFTVSARLGENLIETRENFSVSR